MSKIIVLVFVLLGSVLAQYDRDLYNAAYRGTLEDVENALASGGNPNWINPDYKDTALHKASAYNNLKVVSTLLNAGADPDLPNKMQDTALHKAASEAHLAVVRELLGAGANADALDISGMTPILWATKHDYFGDADTVKVLIDHGADVNIQDEEGFFPLMEAAYKGNVAIVRALLDANANVELADNNGNTALHWVARGASALAQSALAQKADQQEIAKLLLQRRADATKRNSQGNTPADFARHHNDQELANIIDNFTGPVYGPINHTVTSEYTYDINKLYLISGGVIMFIAASLFMAL